MAVLPMNDEALEADLFGQSTDEEVRDGQTEVRDSH